MQEILNAVKDTPIPTILVVSGILFLLLSVADQLAGKMSINPARQRLAVVIGSVLIILGIGLHILPRAPTTQSGLSDAIENGSEEDSNSTIQTTTNHETRSAETRQIAPSPRKLEYGTLEGRVTNKDGKAISTIITLYLDGERIGSQISEQAMGGFFQFSKRSKLSPGIYEIHVAHARDYRPQRIKNVKIEPGVLTHLDIKLSEGDDLQQIDNPVTKEQSIEAETSP